MQCILTDRRNVIRATPRPDRAAASRCDYHTARDPARLFATTCDNSLYYVARFRSRWMRMVRVSWLIALTLVATTLPASAWSAHRPRANAVRASKLRHTPPLRSDQKDKPRKLR